VSSHQIREQVDYPHPISAVWQALTDPAALGEWLMATNFQPRVGHEFTFTAPPGPDWDGHVFCRVTELDPPHRLAYTWRGTDPAILDTLVTFQLEPGSGRHPPDPDPQRLHPRQPLATRPARRRLAQQPAGPPPPRTPRPPGRPLKIQPPSRTTTTSTEVPECPLLTFQS
jgi:uncharacterized protein YndB with AHSA1/START domain